MQKMVSYELHIDPEWASHHTCTLMNVRKMKSISYIYGLLLHRFWSLFIFTSFLVIDCEVLM